MKWSRKRIEKVLRDTDFEYHRVDLPFGLHTPGSDRSETRDLVLPTSLEGKSVLDVGCALGYFSFEAEKRGARRVLAVDVKKQRLDQAKMLADILGSRVEFRQVDIVAEPLEEVFDVVLVLNVIHHLIEPFRALRQLARLTRETMVVEFPTPADRRFRRSAGLPESLHIPDDYPLIGVSSLANVTTDQTFVYTPAALERVLGDHEALFDDIQFVPSPMDARFIAFCRKDQQP